jgi:hypothetical protein
MGSSPSQNDNSEPKGRDLAAFLESMSWQDISPSQANFRGLLRRLCCESRRETMFINCPVDEQREEWIRCVNEVAHEFGLKSVRLRLGERLNSSDTFLDYVGEHGAGVWALIDDIHSLVDCVNRLLQTYQVVHIEAKEDWFKQRDRNQIDRCDFSLSGISTDDKQRILFWLDEDSLREFGRAGRTGSDVWHQRGIVYEL